MRYIHARVRTPVHRLIRMNALLQVNLHTGVQENRKRTILVRAYNVASSIRSDAKYLKRKRKTGVEAN